MLQRFLPLGRLPRFFKVVRAEFVHAENCAKCSRHFSQSLPKFYFKSEKSFLKKELSYVTQSGDGDVFGEIEKGVHEKISAEFAFEEV